MSLQWLFQAHLTSQVLTIVISPPHYLFAVPDAYISSILHII